MPTPLVSVLLPVYNAAPFLEDCLKSLVGQTMPDFEIVAIDDGSTDESPARLDAWSQREPRLRVLRRPHRGLVETLNDGLSHCRAPLVARMDADDICAPERLGRQCGLLDTEPRLDVVSCLVEHFADPGPLGKGLALYDRWLNRLIEHHDIMRERFIESPLPHPSVVFRKHVVEEAGGYRELANEGDTSGPEDYELWLRLAERGCRFGKVPEVLLRWRDHPARLTRTSRRYAVERFLECKARYLASGPLAGCARPILWGAGQTGRRLSKHLIRQDRPPLAFIDIDPSKWGRTLRSAPVEPPERLAPLLAGTEPPVVLAAVSSRGAREKIRRFLDDLGLQEGSGYWCAA